MTGLERHFSNSYQNTDVMYEDIEAVGATVKFDYHNNTCEISTEAVDGNPIPFTYEWNEDIGRWYKA